MRRWKVACINWDKPHAPKAVAYSLHWGELASERYCDTWAEALAYANSGGLLPTEDRPTPQQIVDQLAERMYRRDLSDPVAAGFMRATEGADDE